MKENLIKAFNKFDKGNEAWGSMCIRSINAVDFNTFINVDDETKAEMILDANPSDGQSLKFSKSLVTLINKTIQEITTSIIIKPCPICETDVRLFTTKDLTTGFTDYSYTPQVTCGHQLSVRWPKPNSTEVLLEALNPKDLR